MTDLKSKERAGSLEDGHFSWAVSFTPANSFITDISTWFARDRGNWLSAVAWVSLLGALNIPEASARTALHRMTKSAYLHRETRNGKAGYSVSESFCEWIDDFGRGTSDDLMEVDSENQWVVVAFTVPEVRRADRHALRTILGTLGFASLGNGVWLASAARSSKAQQAIEAAEFDSYVEIFLAEHRGYSVTADLIRRCWDIDNLAARYRTFINEVHERLEHEPLPDARTFAGFILTMNTWRRINADDPRISPTVLPNGWPSDEAKKARDELVRRFYSHARDYVESLHN